MSLTAVSIVEVIKSGKNSTSKEIERLAALPIPILSQKQGCLLNLIKIIHGGINMSLNLNPNLNPGRLLLTGSERNLSIKNGLSKLKLKNLQQSDNPALNVSLSARYNSKLTAYLADGQVSKLVKGINPDANVHQLLASNVGKLV